MMYESMRWWLLTSTLYKDKNWEVLSVSPEELERAHWWNKHGVFHNEFMIHIPCKNTHVKDHYGTSQYFAFIADAFREDIFCYLCQAKPSLKSYRAMKRQALMMGLKWP